MPDFKPTEDIISLSEFRTTLADCVARTRETHRPIRQPQMDWLTGRPSK